METWDVIIIGAGSAGLSAALYTVRSGLGTLVLDEKIAGGTITNAPTIVNYPGFLEISGAELAQKIADHAQKFGAVIHEIETVTALNLHGEIKTVTTPTATYNAKAIIIATGSHYKELGVKGEQEFRGRGVSYCGVCDGPFFRGKHVLVVGGGNSASITTLYLSNLVAQVTLIHRRETLRAEQSLVDDITNKTNIKILWNTEIQEIKGDKQVRTVTLKNNKTKQTQELKTDAVFVQIGEAPNSQLATASGVEIDEHGYIKTNLHQQTNLPGVFTAGDITNHPIKQVGTAVGQGITAALEAYAYIRQPYHKKHPIETITPISKTEKTSKP
ncbi:MAG: thioredoxin-disulfide reductase [Candidatus Bathyarchaeota archaeon]|jgi:thioredoxin reductase (NADPH)|nr:thioredoxin-disulfide reductase [Candidatus Termitimicrobium sp.]MCL2432242.1 thioredoxin-disulfide reductase [Candidatus Termitimicrobium sp.]